MNLADWFAGCAPAWLSPREPGRHRATLTCVETGAVLEAEIPVVGDPLEQRGRPARFDVMEEIARLTRGAVLAEPSMAEVAQRVRELPPPEPLVSRMRLWAHPALGAIVVALMTLFWIGRKLAGRV